MGNDSTYIPFPPQRTDAFLSSFPATVFPSDAVGGPGSPEGVIIGNPGMLYHDTDTDDVWIKIVGTQEFGWVKNGKWTGGSGGGGGGGGGSGNVVASAVDPTGILAVTGPGLCLGLTGSPVDGKVWVKSTAANSATDWVLLIG